MKLCQKINCNNFAIPRGKYCEIHRIRKRNIGNLNTSNLSIMNTSNLETENTTDIIKKQDEDYNFFMQEDIKRICELNEEKELNNILELSKQTFINDIKNKVLDEPNKDLKNFYNIQFKLPSGSNLKRKFPENIKFIDLRNFLNYYFYENKMNIINYNLVLFPNRIFTIENNDDLLYKHNIPNIITFFIQDCDS
jgi:hypothetical protein